MKKTVLSAVLLAGVLIGATAAYAAFSFTVSTSATVSGDLAVTQVVQSFGSVVTTCTLSGPTAVCPNIQMNAGQSYEVNVTLDNTQSTAVTVSLNAATQHGGAVLGISFSPPSGFTIQPLAVQVLEMKVTGVGGGSDTIQLGISA